MGLYSVVALVCFGYDHGEHFPGCTGERGVEVHRTLVEPHGGSKGFWVEAHDPYDIGNASRPFPGGIILPFQFPIRIFFRDGFDPSHR